MYTTVSHTIVKDRDGHPVVLPIGQTAETDIIGEILASMYNDHSATEFGTLLNTAMLSLVGVIIDVNINNDTYALILRLSNDNNVAADRGYIVMAVQKENINPSFAERFSNSFICANLSNTMH